MKVRSHICCILFLFSSLALFPQVSILGADTAQTVTNHFKLELVSQMTTDVLNQQMNLKADTELAYNWQKNGRERTLVLDSLRLKAVLNGNEMVNMFSSREKLIVVKQGVTNTILAETAPENVKNSLQNQYDVPFCKLELDKQGTVVKRLNLASKEIQPESIDTTIANALLFHPRFDPSAKEWSAATELSMGHGSFAKGTLHYTRKTKGKPPFVVKVSGLFENDRVHQFGSPVTIRRARYVVTGEQAYDPKREEWVSGNLKIDVTNDVEAEEKIVGKASGTIIATFKIQ